MSLSTAGVWQVGVWAETVWADGVWREGDAPEPVVVESASGGWGLMIDYERMLERRRRKKREQDEAEEATQALPPVEAEIAQFLHEQEREDEKRAEIERLRKLVSEHSPQALPPRAASAFSRAQMKQTISSLLNLDKELRRMMEDEELAILLMMLED